MDNHLGPVSALAAMERKGASGASFTCSVKTDSGAVILKEAPRHTCSNTDVRCHTHVTGADTEFLVGLGLTGAPLLWARENFKRMRQIPTREVYKKIWSVLVL